ncbi:TIGR02206 family membrane protein [Heyndrickxia ginsengihumi]|uniref:YwaF family protein n=1 Tax=Heyndrickxia ginsengihumi TaxID=363870 RepID=UPI003D1B3212
MQAYFAYHSKLHSFHLFSIEHLLTIAVIVVLSTLLFVYQNGLKKLRSEIRYMLAFLLIISDTLQHCWLVSEHVWSLKKDLPLQLSDIAAILAVVMLLTKSYRLFQFMYFAGLGSSIQAILTPDLGHFSFPHFQYIEFFVSHGGVVLACLFMVVAFNYKPTIPSMWASFFIVNLYGAVIFFLNKLLGANYLYIMKKPRNTSILDYLGPWPWYLLSMELVILLSFYLLYSPFWLKKKM